jgi:hypothetical protein
MNQVTLIIAGDRWQAAHYAKNWPISHMPTKYIDNMMELAEKKAYFLIAMGGWYRKWDEEELKELIEKNKIEAYTYHDKTLVKGLF